MILGFSSEIFYVVTLVPLYEEFVFRGPFWIIILQIKFQKQFSPQVKISLPYTLLVFIGLFEIVTSYVYKAPGMLLVVITGVVCGFLLIKSYLSEKIIFLWLAFVLNGISFGLAHLLIRPNYGIAAAFQAAIIGFVFSWLVIKTQSIWPAVLNHSLWNIFVVLISQI